jgi:transposase
VRLDDLRTGDGRDLPAHLKTQILREIDRLELLMAQLNNYRLMPVGSWLFRY